MESPKRYRPNVAAVVVSAKYPFQCQLFIASRSDIEGAWQFPQGGIDEGETPREALYRELEEEIGTGEVEIIAEYPEWLQYDFPQKIAQKMYPFDGQSQKYFLSVILYILYLFATVNQIYNELLQAQTTFHFREFQLTN